MSFPNIDSKLPDIGPTIFTVMSSLAIQHQAINLGQGFPDYEMDSELIDRVTHYMKSGKNQYVHMNGLPALRKSISEKISYLYSLDINPENEITVTPGGTYAIYTAFTTILNKGDEVIVFEPAYDSYIPNIEINGGIPVLIPLQYPDYKIDWEEVRKKLTSKTKAIIINSPHNPTGSVLSEEDMVQLSSIVKDTGIFIISDEVYEHLIFDGIAHESILRYPELYARSFVCFSFGKVYNCTGWKLGYCVAPLKLMEEFRKVHQFNCFSCNSPVQFALADHLTNRSTYMDLGTFVQKKRDHFADLMKQTKFKPLPSHGSYFQMYSYADISQENERDFSIRLTREYGVATIPVSAFYRNKKDDQVLRFCFCKNETTLENAVERLIRL